MGTVREIGGVKRVGKAGLMASLLLGGWGPGKGEVVKVWAWVWVEGGSPRMFWVVVFVGEVTGGGRGVGLELELGWPGLGEGGRERKEEAGAGLGKEGDEAAGGRLERGPRAIRGGICGEPGCGWDGWERWFVGTPGDR